MHVNFEILVIFISIFFVHFFMRCESVKRSVVIIIPRIWTVWERCSKDARTRYPRALSKQKWNESGFRQLLCTYRLNLALGKPRYQWAILAPQMNSIGGWITFQTYRWILNVFSVNTIHCQIVGVLFVHRLRRWLNQHMFFFCGKFLASHITIVLYYSD